MPDLNIMLKPASGSCNCRCVYCFYGDEMANRETASFGMMSDETAENLIRKALAYVGNGNCTFGFQGGEPTLRGIAFFRTFVEKVREYAQPGARIHYALQTNGLLLDEEWGRFFHENGFLIGLSLDGTAEIHNRFRPDPEGKGTHARVLKAARLLEKFHVPFNILTVVNARTARSIGAIYARYQKEGFLYQQYIPCLDPLGEERGSRDYSLTPEAFGDFLIRLFDLWYRDRKAGRFIYIHYFECLAGILAGKGPGACGMSGVCSVQNVVEADGSVYSCDFYMLDAYCIGNVNENDFTNLLERHRPFLQSSGEGLDDCRSCPYGRICRGGCRRDRQYMDGIGKNYYCGAYKRFFEHALPGLFELVRMR